MTSEYEGKILAKDLEADDWVDLEPVLYWLSDGGLISSEEVVPLLAAASSEYAVVESVKEVDVGGHVAVELATDQTNLAVPAGMTVTYRRRAK